MPPDSASRSGKYADIAYHHLKKLIFSGAILPGRRINLDAIQNDLGISRQPVRDAVTRLAVESLLVVIPQVGCMVPEVSPADVRDFFLVFAGFEARMASFAAERATARQILRMRQLSLEIAELNVLGNREAQLTDAPTFRELNRDLHDAIHEYAAAPVLTKVAATLMDRYDYFVASASASLIYETRPGVQEEHDRVIEAIARRDPEAASHEMEQHILNTTDRVLTILNERSAAANATNTADGDISAAS